MGIPYSARLLKGIRQKEFSVSEDVKRNGENEGVEYLQVLLLQRGGRVPVLEPPGEELLWSGDMPCAQVFHLPHLQGHGGLRPYPEVLPTQQGWSLQHWGKSHRTEEEEECCRKLPLLQEDGLAHPYSGHGAWLLHGKHEDWEVSSACY